MSKEPSQLHNMVKQRYSGSKWAGEDIIHVKRSTFGYKKILKKQFTELNIDEFLRLLGIIFGF
jgi:hypothetical protein